MRNSNKRSFLNYLNIQAIIMPVLPSLTEMHKLPFDAGLPNHLPVHAMQQYIKIS